MEIPVPDTQRPSQCRRLSGRLPGGVSEKKEKQKKKARQARHTLSPCRLSRSKWSLAAWFGPEGGASGKDRDVLSGWDPATARKSACRGLFLFFFCLFCKSSAHITDCHAIASRHGEDGRLLFAAPDACCSQFSAAEFKVLATFILNPRRESMSADDLEPVNQFTLIRPRSSRSDWLTANHAGPQTCGLMAAIGFDFAVWTELFSKFSPEKMEDQRRSVKSLQHYS